MLNKLASRIQLARTFKQIRGNVP